MEVGAHTRKQLLQKKVKLEWLICKIEDYIAANRCLNASDSITDFAIVEERKPALSAQENTS
jgi:hypothetical protein